MADQNDTTPGTGKVMLPNELAASIWTLPALALILGYLARGDRLLEVMMAVTFALGYLGLLGQGLLRGGVGCLSVVLAAVVWLVGVEPVTQAVEAAAKIEPLVPGLLLAGSLLLLWALGPRSELHPLEAASLAGLSGVVTWHVFRTAEKALPPATLGLAVGLPVLAALLATMVRSGSGLSERLDRRHRGWVALGLVLPGAVLSVVPATQTYGGPVVLAGGALAALLNLFLTGTATRLATGLALVLLVPGWGHPIAEGLVLVGFVTLLAALSSGRATLLFVLATLLVTLAALLPFGPTAMAVTAALGGPVALLAAAIGRHARLTT